MTPVEDNWGKLVNGTHTTGAVWWQRAQCELWGLVWLTGDGAAGAIARQQHKESCEALSKARSSTHSCLERQSSGCLVLNFLKQPLIVSMGTGASWGVGCVETSAASGCLVGVDIPYGTSQISKLGQMGSIDWVTPSRSLTTLTVLLIMRQLSKAEKNLYILENGILRRSKDGSNKLN